MDDGCKPKAIKYIGIVYIQFAIGAIAFFWSAGTIFVPRGIAYFVMHFAFSVLGSLYLLRSKPETLAARSVIASDTKGWDRLILAVFVPLAYVVIYLAAGLPRRLGEAYPAVTLFWIGLLVNGSASFVLIWAVRANRNFESSVRIQTDRKHQICSTGPYAVVRHPGYSGIVLWAVAMIMMFGRYTGVVSIAIIALILLRTALEDATLRRELPGYANYSLTVRSRILPFVW